MKRLATILLAGALLLPAPVSALSTRPGTACVGGRWVASANRMIWPARHVFVPNPACPRR